MQSLLAQVPIPSSSPALASLLARALATSPEGSGRETEVKIAALERAGRVNELIEMLGEANEFGGARSLRLGAARRRPQR